jgi:murein DD-endopeptidase MepM/ murein hydrolase activator NlpD
VVNTHLNVADYVHGGITDEWKVVWIPMRDLTGPMTAAIVNLYLEFNQPGVVWLDEVKVVEHLVWPLPGITKAVSSPFGDHWQDRYCAGARQLHTAEDYRSEQSGGKTVVATHHGEVRYIFTTDEWGGYVVIESEGKAFTTTSVHVDPVVRVGEKVWPGKVIGTTSYIANPHLHFTLRMAPFPEDDVNRVLRGRLPEGADCGGDPAFPERFIDPKWIDWQ